MLKDITIGMYYPVKSALHSLDPRVKLFGTMVFVISLFFVNSIPTFILITAALVALVITSRVPFRFMVRGLRGIIVLFVIAGLFNLFLTPGGDPLFSFGVIKITYLGIYNCVTMIYRIIYLIVGTSILTLTTTPGSLTAGLEKSLGFLNNIRVPVHEFAMMMSIALRFIPILMEEADKIMKAQQARGADFTSGGLIRRAKSLIPILVPLFVSAFRRAGDLAFAMEARCYHGGEGRTKMNPLKYSSRDGLSYVLIFLFIAALIVLRILF